MDQHIGVMCQTFDLVTYDGVARNHHYTVRRCDPVGNCGNDWLVVDRNRVDDNLSAAKHLHRMCSGGKRQHVGRRVIRPGSVRPAQLNLFLPDIENMPRDFPRGTSGATTGSGVCPFRVTSPSQRVINRSARPTI